MKIYKATTNKNKVHFDLTMLRRSLIIERKLSEQFDETRSFKTHQMFEA